MLVAAAVTSIVAWQSFHGPVVPHRSRDIVVVSGNPIIHSRPAANTVGGATLPASEPPRSADGTMRVNGDVALLNDRFMPDPGYIWKGERLRAQLLGIVVNDVRFDDLQVTCDATMCRVSARVLKGSVPADRASTFGLIHSPQVASIGAGDELEPGPIAFGMTYFGEMSVVGYFISR